MKKIMCLMAAGLIGFMSLSNPSLAAGKLTIFTWSEYIDPQVVEQFEKKYDVKVTMDYYDSNEEMIAKLQSGGGLGTYDLIVPSTYAVAGLTGLKLIQPLNHELLPNLKNLSEPFKNMEADPGNKWSVPYQWGTTGIAVKNPNQAEIPATWGLIFDPEKALGNVTLIDSSRDSMASALKYLGFSLNTTKPEEIEKALKLMVATKKRPDFMGFDGGLGGLNKLLSGSAMAVQAYSGESLRAQDEDPTIEFILPEEGYEVWTDLVAIPTKAPNLENAHAFINFLLEPEISAQQAAYNFAATPNEAAKAFVPKEHLNNPAMYPPLVKSEKLEYIEDLGPDNRLYEEVWTSIKTQ